MSAPPPSPQWESDFDTEPLGTSVWDYSDLLAAQDVSEPAESSGREFQWPHQADLPALQRWKTPAAIGAAGAAGVALIVLIGRLFAGGDEPEENRAAAPTTAAATTTTTTPAADPALRRQLIALLPPGYERAGCRDVAAQSGAVAAVECGPNADAPNTTGRFVLFRDKAGLQTGLDAVIGQMTVQLCPGPDQLYQSPGAWQRIAAPTVPAGTLVCGLQTERPTVVWSTEDKRLLAAITSDPQGPSLAQLYTWWAAHS